MMANAMSPTCYADLGRTPGGRPGLHAVAALFIRKASLEPFSPPEVIGEMYKLTPTELRVLLAIVDIGGVPR